MSRDFFIFFWILICFLNQNKHRRRKGFYLTFFKPLNPNKILEAPQGRMQFIMIFFNIHYNPTPTWAIRRHYIIDFFNNIAHFDSMSNIEVRRIVHVLYRSFHALFLLLHRIARFSNHNGVGFIIGACHRVAVFCIFNVECWFVLKKVL